MNTDIETPLEDLTLDPAQPLAPTESSKNRTKELTVTTPRIGTSLAAVVGTRPVRLLELEIVNEGKGETKSLNPTEQARLTELEVVIRQSRENEKSSFLDRAEAFFEIQDKKLYRETHKSAEAYFAEKWACSRAHSNRIATAGAIIARKRVSPTGDTILMMTSESHYRPLTKLQVIAQDSVITLLGQWTQWSGDKAVSPRMVESAVLVLNPPTGPNEVGTRENPLVTKLSAVIDEARKQLPKGTAKEIRQVFDQLKKKAIALGNPPRKTGIDWTDATWNPLQGCSPASAGCDNCYAAQLVATRLSHVYPGLASEAKKDKKTTFVFNNVVRLLPEQLGDPLRDHTPRRYFVNSMSDLFHKKVPEEFIEAVFDVMIKAHWHQFQVLTKRPGRMAEFTTRYFNDKVPPRNIWLGTSAENQQALDERLPHLLKVKTAVPWLSCEPLIGPIEFDSLEGIKWVVVGGESGKGARKMELPWATSIRDACKEANVPFFFKQWGAYGPDGKKLKKAKKDGLTPPALEGDIYNSYPEQRFAAGDDKGGKVGSTALSSTPGINAPKQ